MVKWFEVIFIWCCNARRRWRHAKMKKQLSCVNYRAFSFVDRTVIVEMSCYNIIRPRRSQSAAAYSDQSFPWMICRSVGPSVCLVHCGKTADRIRMPFGIIVRTGPGMRHVVGFGDRSTGRGTFGANLRRAIVTNGNLLSQQRGPLPKLLWADLLTILYVLYLQQRFSKAPQFVWFQ